MKALYVLVGLMFIAETAAYAEDVRYTTHIKQIFDQKCAFCHGGDAPEYGDFKKDEKKYTQMFKGPKMDSYAHLVHFTGWPDTGAIMRRLDDGMNTKENKPGNMYQNLGANEQERQKNLKLFRDWVGNWTLKRFPELTKDDLAGIKVQY